MWRYSHYVLFGKYNPVMSEVIEKYFAAPLQLQFWRFRTTFCVASSSQLVEGAMERLMKIWNLGGEVFL